MPGALQGILGSFLRKAESIRYTEDGNRSIVELDFRSYLKDPHLLRLFTEYRATGHFAGHLAELPEADARFVAQLSAGLKVLSEMQDRYTVGAMWAKFNQEMLRSALAADPRLYNHIGALSYKTFKPLDMGLEAVIREVLKVLVVYGHLGPQVQQFDGLLTELNSSFFTLDGRKLNAGIRGIEEWRVIQEKAGPTKGGRVLEIGAGNGQLANLFLRDGSKMVIIDLPGMHARSPYFLYKAGHQVCTYDRFLEEGKNIEELWRRYDVVYLPPWEAESLAARFDLAVNVHSLGEMSVEEAVRYLKVIDKTCDRFFSLNTNTRGLDRAKQTAYPENSSLEYGKHLSMKAAATGSTVSDTVLAKVLHYGYVVYRKESR